MVRLNLMEPANVTARRKRVTLGGLLASAAVACLAYGAASLAPPGAAASSLDAAGLRWWQWQRTPGLDAFFMTATWLGSIAVLLPAAAAIAWRERQHGRSALFVPVSVVAASLLAHLTKLLVERPRPNLFEPLVALPADSSFPSAHSMQAASFAFALLMRPGRRPGPALFAGAAALVLVVGLSRLYLQVHYPTDVAFGTLAAALLVAGLRCLPAWRSAGS